MKQVRIILKSGKELNFAAEDEEIYKEVITAIDGTQYAIVKDAVEATIITPMVKCPNCGEWVVPVKREVVSDERYAVISACPYCNYGIGNA